MTEGLRLEKDGATAWLYLDRPDKRNAISFEMWQALPDLVAEVDNDPDTLVLVIRGADDVAFSAGADISEFKTLRSTEAGAHRYNEATEAAAHAVRSSAKPTIAMVQGPCMGGGCGLAISCDLRFCDHSARFGITPAKLGIVYGFHETKGLVDLVGPSQAKYILFSGLQLDAERALRIGLVDEIHDAGDLEQATTDFASTVASRAQFSVRSAKRIVEIISEGATEDTEESKDLRLRSFASADYQEGVQAFLEKRGPRFSYS